MSIEINGAGVITGVDSLSTPAVTNAAGSASVPSITFTGDTNTGLYSPGADQVAVTTGGTGRLFIDSSGRVGIGTSTARAGLTVALGSASIPAAGASTGSAVFSNATDGGVYGVVVGANTSGLGYIQSQRTDGTATTYDLAIQPNGGRVGIGSTSPSAKLQVNQNTDSGTALSVVSASANTVVTSDYASLYLQNTNTTNNNYNTIGFVNDQGAYSAGIHGIYTSHTSGSQSGAIAFGTSNAGSYAERARIDSSGRLLVGTSSAPSALGPSIQSARAGGAYFVAANTSTVSSSGDILGEVHFLGNQSGGYVHGATISATADATWSSSSDGPTRLVFSTCADGASSPTEALRIDSFQQLKTVPTYNNTSALAANVGVASTGNLYRSTSSAKYKTNIETIEDSYSDALLSCRPVWYKSICKTDNPDFGWWGFIAEEVAEIDPRLVYWKTTEVTYDENGSAVETPCAPEPEGVAYDRFVPHLLNLIKRQKEHIEALEARLTAAGI